jgi:cytochrome c5
MALDGKALVQERCTLCHSTDRIYKHAKVDRAHWAETVDAMIKKDAKLSDTERKAVIDHLASQ